MTKVWVVVAAAWPEEHEIVAVCRNADRAEAERKAAIQRLGWESASEECITVQEWDLLE